MDNLLKINVMACVRIEDGKQGEALYKLKVKSFIEDKEFDTIEETTIKIKSEIELKPGKHLVVVKIFPIAEIKYFNDKPKATSKLYYRVLRLNSQEKGV